ncbi:MAG: hypothetical protein ACYCR3_09000 [Acidithiobacillus sp.]|jgi:hypothetical protein
MNNDQLKHIASALNAIAFAEFAAFGYAGIHGTHKEWVLVAVSALFFVNIQAAAVWVLSFLKDQETKNE